MNPNTATPTELEAAAIINEAEDIITGAAIMKALPKDATFFDLIEYIKADQRRVALVAKSLGSD
jgi:predicted aconitase with swiveling domain